MLRIQNFILGTFAKGTVDCPRGAYLHPRGVLMAVLLTFFLGFAGAAVAPAQEQEREQDREQEQEQPERQQRQQRPAQQQDNGSKDRNCLNSRKEGAERRSRARIGPRITSIWFPPRPRRSGMCWPRIPA